MQKSMNKYFWDGETNLSGAYKLRRMFEYASFPDLINYPVEDLKKYLPAIDVDSLRTSEKRKRFIKLIVPLLPEVQSWDDIVNRLLDKVA
ncbi:MAG: hypothetical protein V2A69_16585 [Pseudomonadota bacterium]